MTVVRMDFFGFTRTLRVDQPAAVEALRSHFGPFVENAPVGTGIDLTLDDEQLAAIHHNEQNVLHLVGALIAPRFLLLHASLVATPLDDGAAVAFAGVSGAGKTTTALIAERLGYHRLGDDLCLLEWDTGRIAAIPGEAHVRPWTDDLLPDSSRDLPAMPLVLRRLQQLIVMDGHSTSLTNALLHCTFGVTPATTPDHLRRLATVTQHTRASQVQPVDWRDLPAHTARARLLDDVRTWLGCDTDGGSAAGVVGIQARTGICAGISMLPAIRPGELVLMKHTEADVGPGDVVVYQVTPDAPLVMHRVIACSGDQLTTRGDNAPHPETIARDAVIAVVLNVRRDGTWQPVPSPGSRWHRLGVAVRAWLRRLPGVRFLVRALRSRPLTDRQ